MRLIAVARGTPLWGKAILGGVWLLLAYWCQNKVIGRWIFSMAGSIIGSAHIGGVAGGLLARALFRSSSTALPSGVAGFFVGAAVGVVLGCGVGVLAAKNGAVYWFVQIVAVGFGVFMPLWRW